MCYFSVSQMYSTLVCIFALRIWTISLITGSNMHRSMDVNLIMRSPILEGDDLEMKCLFLVPERTSVSSVKWYKGSREIFRYEHKPVPKKQILPFGNLAIDEKDSNVQKLLLKHVPSFMSGNITCEVTLEDPSAKAVAKSARLLVAIPPTEAPTLDASLLQYHANQIMHQKLLTNCTSAPSKPATNLTIYVNDFPYCPEQQNFTSTSMMDTRIERFRLQPDILVNNDLAIRRIELELDISQHHFVNGQIRVKCASTLFNLHNMSSDELVIDESRSKSHNRKNSYFNQYRSMASSSRRRINIWCCFTTIMIAIKFL